MKLLWVLKNYSYICYLITEKKEMRENIDNFKNFIIKESVDKSTDFETIDKVIRTYIKYVLKTDEKINEFIPNTHIAETFKDVLIYSELESKNEDTFHNVKHDPYDSIGTNNPDDYDRLEDGRYVKKETYSVGINHLLIPEYFDLKRLKSDGVSEIHRTYQKLREKRDIVRNNIILGGIVLSDYTHRPLAKSYNLKIK
jgi:hypothetical protein